MMNEQNFMFISEAKYSTSFQSYSSNSNAAASQGIWNDDPAIAGVCYQEGNRVVSYAAPYGVTVIQPTQTRHVTQYVKTVSSSRVYDNGCANTSYSSNVSRSHGIPAMEGDVEPPFDTYEQSRSNVHQEVAFQQMQSKSAYVQEYQVYNNQLFHGTGGNYQPDYSCHSQGTNYVAGCSRVAAGLETGGMSSYYEQVNQYSQSQQYGGASSFSSAKVVQSLDVMESTACRTQPDLPMFADYNNEGQTCSDQAVALQAIEWPYKGDVQTEQELGVVVEDIDDLEDYVSFKDKEEQRQNESSYGVQIEEIFSPVYDESYSEDETLQNFEYIEDKQEFEEWDLSLHIPGQESILNEENMEVLKNKLNDWLSAKEPQEMPAQQEVIVAAAAKSKSISSPEEEQRGLVSLSLDKIPERASSAFIPKLNDNDEENLRDIDGKCTSNGAAVVCSESNLKCKDNDEDLPFVDEKCSAQAAENSDPKSNATPSKDATTVRSGWRGCLKRLRAFAGRALEEVAACYIKGLLL